MGIKNTTKKGLKIGVRKTASVGRKVGATTKLGFRRIKRAW